MGIGAAVAALGVAGSIGGALISSHGAQSAAQTQAQADQQAAQIQLQMYQQTRGDLQPYMQSGYGALGQIDSLYGINPMTSTGGAAGGGAGMAGVPNTSAMMTALQNFPGYQFMFNQGQTALDRSAASQGLLLSGAQLQASQLYGQNAAMANAWNPYISQLNALAGMGQNAAAGVGTQGTALAGQAGQATAAGGAALAAGQIGSANAITGGISNGIYGSLMGYNMMNQGQVGNYYGAYAGGDNSVYSDPYTALNMGSVNLDG